MPLRIWVFIREIAIGFLDKFFGYRKKSEDRNIALNLAVHIEQLNEEDIQKLYNLASRIGQLDDIKNNHNSIIHNLPFIYGLLMLCSDDELATIENNLNSGGTPDLIYQILYRMEDFQFRNFALIDQILSRKFKEEGFSHMRKYEGDGGSGGYGGSRGYGGGGGREATSKGSIGHDLLNVKTLRPREWRQRIAMIFLPETILNEESLIFFSPQYEEIGK